MPVTPPLPAETRPAIGGPLVAIPSRVACGFLSGVILLVLGAAAWLNPSTAGHGTHTQLGLPPCAWAQWFGKPCMTCGMTTSFAHAANLDFVSAFRAQPAGTVLCIVMSSVFWVSLHTAVTGSRAGAVVARLLGTKAMILSGVILGGAWLYKVMTWNP
ncbi:MAG: DUF2752 domain-containing protein [Phycisphaerales bacterium]